MGRGILARDRIGHKSDRGLGEFPRRRTVSRATLHEIAVGECTAIPGRSFSLSVFVAPFHLSFFRKSQSQNSVARLSSLLTRRQTELSHDVCPRQEDTQPSLCRHPLEDSPLLRGGPISQKQFRKRVRENQNRSRYTHSFSTKSRVAATIPTCGPEAEFGRGRGSNHVICRLHEPALK